ncbi:hypothetical protein RRG08_027371 [Elysia crispata]|uniref:Uncharacterized protein n=1 Tax=Elysia crispata TaxID=231223 RepID=A0AAE1D1B9_9GAST|nr:hypothetical protein RRG08_027371 [Elysia crispata]
MKRGSDMRSHLCSPRSKASLIRSLESIGRETANVEHWTRDSQCRALDERQPMSSIGRETANVGLTTTGGDGGSNHASVILT